MCFKENIYKKCHFRLLLKKRIITLVSAINQILFMRKNFALATILSIIVGLSIFSLNNTNILDDVLNIKSTESTLKILLPPTVNFTFTNNKSCSGSTISFTPTVSGENGDLFYLWDFGDSTSSTNEAPNHTYSSNGCNNQDFTVILTVTDDDGDVVVDKIVTVLPRPDINFYDPSVSNQNNAFNNCGSTDPVYAIQLQNQSPSNSCISQYTISWGDGSPDEVVTSFPIGTSIPHEYNGIDVFDMTIIALGDNGCTSSKTFTVKNYTNPSAGFVNPGSTTNLCIPMDPIEFLITNWGGNTDDCAYAVNYGDGSAPIVYTQSDLFAFDPNGTLDFPVPYEYSSSSCPNDKVFRPFLVVTNECSSSTVNLNDISVIVNPTLAFDGPDVGCLNQSIIFQNNSIPGYDSSCDRGAVYFWDFGDGSPIFQTPYGLPTSVTHTYTSTGPFTVTMYSDNDFCDPTTAITDQICIEEPPVPVFNLNTYEGCFPFTSIVTNATNTTNMCSTVSYLWEVIYTPANCGTTESWEFLGGTNATSENPQFQFNAAGIYNISLEATNDCGSVTSSAQSVSVKSPPTANIANIANYCGATSISPSATIEICTDNPGDVIYSWSFPGGKPESSNIANPVAINYATPGNYTVTLEVTNNCGNSIVTENFSIFDQPVIDAQPLSSQTLCQNSISTDLEVTASVGTGSLSYQWYVNTINSTSGGNEIFGATNSTYDPPTDTIGTLYYYVVISQTLDATCNITSEISEIEVLSAPTITLQPIDSSVCENGTPNTLEVVYENGTGTATYQWFENSVDNNTSGTEISGETSSTYTPLTDTIGTIYYYCEISFSSGGCTEIYSETAMVEVTPGVVVDVQPISNQDICVGGTIDAALSVTHSGGTGNVTYQWFSNVTNDNFGGTLIPGATNSTYTPIAATTDGTQYYYVEISTSGPGCSGVASNVAIINIVPDPIVDAQPEISQSLCQSATPTDLEVVVSGGIGGNNYQWYSNTTNNTTGGTIISGATNASYTPPTSTVGTLYYYVVITQSNPNLDCEVLSNTSEVETLTAPVFTLQPDDSSVCENGIPNDLKVAYTNGTGTATYQWYSSITDNNSGGILIPGATNVTYTPPTTTTGILYYYCEISFSSGGCTEIYSDTAMVEVTPGIAVDVQPIVSQDICVGGVIDIALSVTHSGGTGTATYQWFSNVTNDNFSGTLITGATNSTYTPVAATTDGSQYYYVEISLSGNGCSGIASEVSTIVVLPDPVVDTQPLVSQSLCQSAIPTNLDVVVAGGIGGNNYQWYSNTTDINSGGTLISGATNASFTPPTTTVGILYYYVEISQGSSNLDCFVVSNTSKVEITQAPSFITQPMSSDICINEVANNLEVSYENGTGIPIYQWYSNTTDMNSGGTPITGANSAIYTPPTNNVGGLFYYCEITFSVGGCLLIVSNTAEVNISQTPVIVDFFDEVCSGLLFEFDPSTIGGNIVPSGTTYTWNLSNISPVGSISGATDSTSPQVNFSQTLTNLTTSVAVATYAVTPTSGICVGATFDVSITVNPGISVSVIINDSKCYQDDNGSIDAIISGGTPISPGNPYIINWTGPGGFSSNNASISNLEPGTYSLSVEDNSSCTFNMDYEVSEPNELILTTDAVNDISCFGFNDGEILISISGGTLPYTYLWKTSNGSGLIPSDEDQSNLSEGTYDVEITDANNCVITGQYQIIEPPELLISETHNSLLCFGDSNGTITVNIDQSSIPDYIYTISGIDYLGNPFNTTQTQSGTSFTANNLLAGIYDILVTDINDCEKIITAIEILQPIDIVVDVTKVNIVCYGDSNGSITLNVSGGVPSYTYLWSDLGSGPVRTNLSAGIYTVTVTDQNDCFKIIDIEILGPEFHIEPEVRNISCFGEDDGYINLNIFGGVSPITASWDDDATAGVERNNLPPGTYTVLVTDSDSPSCPINQSFIITEPSPISSSGLIVDALDCDIVESGSINLQVTGGTLPFTFLWSNGVTTEDLTNIPPGDYSVIITDTNGCEEVNSFTVNRFPALDVLVDTITDFNCETRVVNQIFEAKPTGGVPPYQIRWSSGVVSGANNEFMTTDQEGLVLITIFDGIGCEKSISYDIVIPVLGDADFSLTSEANNTFGFYSIEDPIQFTNTAIGDFTNISWDFGDGNFSSELDPVHTYVNEGTYIVLQTVTYPFGCVYTKQITLIVEKGYSLIMPNAFTPNGDAMNAYFAPESVALNDITFNVYDTWGSLIYSEKGESIKGWNGKINDAEAENGNYYFTLSAKTFYGKTITKKGAFVSIK